MLRPMILKLIPDLNNKNITKTAKMLPLKESRTVGLMIRPENIPPIIVFPAVTSNADGNPSLTSTYSTITFANPSFMNGKGRGSRFSKTNIDTAKAVKNASSSNFLLFVCNYTSNKKADNTAKRHYLLGNLFYLFSFSKSSMN